MDRGWWYKLSQFWTNWQVTVVMEPGVIDSSDGGADDDEENNDRGQRFRRYLSI